MKKADKRLKGRIVFLFALGIFSIFLYIMNFGPSNGVVPINSTMLAFSYKYGFVSRALIGTVYQWLNHSTPFQLMDYESVVHFSKMVTIIYYILLFAFYGLCLKKCDEKSEKNAQPLILFLTIFAVPMFCTAENSGRLDIYMVIFSLMAAMLLILEKAEILVVVLAALGVMTHQGYVFMYANIILILLLYKAISNEGRKRKKYAILFAATFFVVSVLFLWFELFSHMNGNQIYEDVVATAKALSYNGEYHMDVIDHEILGIDLSEKEAKYHIRNAVEFPIFLILFFPYIVMGVQFFRGLLRMAESKQERYKYFFVAIGAVTMLPDFLLKVDYGRWIFAVIFYYFVVILILLAMGDQKIGEQLENQICSIKEKYAWSALFMAYPMLLTPLLDLPICNLVAYLAQLINVRCQLW